MNCQAPCTLSTKAEEVCAALRGQVSDGVPTGVKNPLHYGLSRRLAGLRNAGGLSLRDVAEVADVSHNTVRNIEAEEFRANIQAVERIAVGLGVSPVWLAFGDDGEAPFRERVRRYGIPPFPPPDPEPAHREFRNNHRGVGARLKRAREAAGLSMRELGRRTELTVASISLIEAERSVPLVSTVEALAKELEVAPGWLAYGIGQGPPASRAS